MILKMAALAKIQAKMKVGELKTIRFLSGVTRLGRILNKSKFKKRVYQREDIGQVFWRQSHRGKVNEQFGQAIAGLFLFFVLEHTWQGLFRSRSSQWSWSVKNKWE